MLPSPDGAGVGNRLEIDDEAEAEGKAESADATDAEVGNEAGVAHEAIVARKSESNGIQLALGSHCQFCN